MALELLKYMVLINNLYMISLMLYKYRNLLSVDSRKVVLQDRRLFINYTKTPACIQMVYFSISWEIMHVHLIIDPLTLWFLWFVINIQKDLTK